MVTPPRAASLRVALVGAGTVGTAVTDMLHEANHEIVGVTSRTSRSAERAAMRWSAPLFDLADGAPACDVVLIATSDSSIEPVATRIASWITPGVIACHFAGSVGTEPLRAIEAAGGRVCALHPVASCPSVEAALARLPGCAWGVTCAPDLREWVKRIVERDLQGRAVVIRAEDRPAWHAAAVMTAGGTAALMSAGERVLASIGVSQPEGILGPLCAGVVENARAAGDAGAVFTGPVVRGDEEVVARHVRGLRERAPELTLIYALATRTVAAAARLAGRLDTVAERGIERALEGTWS